MGGRALEGESVSGRPQATFDYAPQPWVSEALCAGLPVEVFVPDTSAFGPAKDICAKCPVRVPCREYALDTRQEYGVWGGTDPGERRKILRWRRLEAASVS